MVDRAKESADILHAYHFFEDEPSTLRSHCEAHQDYDDLAAKYDDAVARGDTKAASAIGATLSDLGEELSYDEYLAWDYFGGYDSCFCLAVDDFFGPHSAYVDIQYGLSTYQPSVDEFTGNKRGSIAGVGVGFAFPATQQGAYGFVRAGFYDTTASSADLFSPPTGYTARNQWLVTGDAGLGLQLVDNIGVRASGGLALAGIKVTGPTGGSDTHVRPGYTVDAGLDVKIAPKWKVTLDTRFTYLRDTNFNPAPGVNFAMAQSIYATMIGVRYTFGNTAGGKTW